ncbi:MAG: hemolysin family protein [Actinomycetales bacterium]|nr:hemolysin family protein [Actinomycetales bacterium]
MSVEMWDVVGDVLVVLAFVLLGGFFAAAELALVSLRDMQVQRLSERGRRGRRLAALVANPTRFLAAVQVAVTLAGFVSAGFGASTIAPKFAPVLIGAGLSSGLANSIAFILVTVLIAYISLVIGELVPKRIAMQRTEQVALLAATPIDVIARLFRPFIAAISVATNAIVRMLGMDPKASREQMSGEELRDLVAAHEDLSRQERDLIDDVFSAGDRELREVMIPRTEVEFLDATLPLTEAVSLVSDQPHSRYPVIRGTTDDVVGFVHIRDILAPRSSEAGVRVGSLIRPVVSFPGTNDVLSTLNQMRRQRQHLAIVVDEYGGTAGIITMEDLVEELVGEIEDEYDTQPTGRAGLQHGELVVEGLMNLEDFADEAGRAIPDGPYETVAGFVVAELGRLPQVGDLVGHEDMTFEVLELDGRRIAKVKAQIVTAEELSE